MNKYKCVIIIEETVRAESTEEAKKAMCDTKIKKDNVIAEKIAVSWI